MQQQSQHVRPFDTLRYVKRLVAVGVTQSQAEVQAETMAEIIDDNLVTKKDLEEVRADLKRDIKELDLKIETVRKEIEIVRKEVEVSKNELTAAIAKASYKTLISLGTMVAIGVTILGFLIKLH